MSGMGNAQTYPRVEKAMADLKDMTEKLGTPRLEGEEAVGGKNAPRLYFGSTK